MRNYNQLGTTASAGCVRLTVADAKWIYDNCEIGTLIEIYEEDDPGPLGKPEAIKLPEGSGWDPTDPDPENPTWSIRSTVMRKILEEKFDPDNENLDLIIADMHIVDQEFADLCNEVMEAMLNGSFKKGMFKGRKGVL